MRRYFFARAYRKELFSGEIFKLDRTFLSTIILDILLGFSVGWIAGAGGTHGLFQILLEKLTVIDSASLIGTIIAGGGGGPIGGAPGIFFFILIIIMYIVQGLMVGALSGLPLGVFSGLINCAVKKGILESIFCLVNLDQTTTKKGVVVFKSMLKGVGEGLIIGALNGLAQGIITAILAVKMR
jgi:hypothetical protein